MRRKLRIWLLVNKWIEKIVDAGNSFPNFHEFSKFIKENAEIAKHALWSRRTTINPTVSKRKSLQSIPRVQGLTHMTQAGQTQEFHKKGNAL